MKKLLLFLATALASQLGIQAQSMPPIFAPGERILFQGDSITDGGRGRGSDPNHMLGHGYVFIIGAKFGAVYPERNLTFFNRGISGNRVTDLKTRWQKDTLELKPDVLSILIGINDAGATVENRPGAIDAKAFEETYDQLLKDTIAAQPKVKIILCEPFVFKGSHTSAAWENWQRETDARKQAVVRLAAKYKVPLVRFQKILDDACQRAPQEYWVWDGVHPTAAGHQLLADEWVRTYQEFYGKP